MPTIVPVGESYENAGGFASSSEDNESDGNSSSGEDNGGSSSSVEGSKTGPGGFVARRDESPSQENEEGGDGPAMVLPSYILDPKKNAHKDGNLEGDQPGEIQTAMEQQQELAKEANVLRKKIFDAEREKEQLQKEVLEGDKIQKANLREEQQEMRKVENHILMEGVGVDEQSPIFVAKPTLRRRKSHNQITAQCGDANDEKEHGTDKGAASSGTCSGKEDKKNLHIV